MEKLNYKKEIIFWILLLIPFVYLAYVWNSLPDRVPIHFGLHGEPNGWGSRSMELLMPVINIFIYALLLFIPRIDPKKMNYDFFKSIYYKIRLLIIVFMSAINIVVINAGTTGMHIGTQWIGASTFLLFALLGNFIINIKSNWFVGVRTPWTLSSDTVWKKTHAVCGRIFFYGGLFCFALILIIRKDELFIPLLLTFVIGTAFFAYVYSYWLFKQEGKTKTQ